MNKTYPYQNLSLEDMPNEVWKDVVGYEGIYQVSNLARVKCLRTKDSLGRKRKPLIRKQTISKVGYLVVCLRKEEYDTICYVHTLVAEAFLQHTDNKQQVDHIDTDRKNNVVTNLRWCTFSENMLNPITNKRLRETLKRNAKTEKWKKHHENMNRLSKTPEAMNKRSESIKRNGIFGKKIRKPVIQMDLEGNVIREFDGIVTAQKETNITHISMCCLGKRHVAGGYKWKFKD